MATSEHSDRSTDTEIDKGDFDRDLQTLRGTFALLEELGRKRPCYVGKTDYYFSSVRDTNIRLVETDSL